MDVQERALKLAASFSFITNKLNYCGPKNAHKVLEKLLNDKKHNKEKIIEHFEKYEGLFVYLKRIAEINKTNPFNYKVIESYWLGNKFLKGFSKKEMEKIIDSLVKRGLPSTYAKKLKNKLPRGMIPHHSFNVLFVGVGMTSGTVPTNIVTMNNCIVSFGEVLEADKEKIKVMRKSLEIKKGNLVFGKNKEEKITKGFVNPKKGDVVAIHWNQACKVLTEREKENLEKYTKRNIFVLNQAGFFSTD